MSLTLRPALSRSAVWLRSRRYATVTPSAITPQPPPPPPTYVENPVTELDVRLLSELASLGQRVAPLSSLVQQYQERAGRVLDVSLPYESRPLPHRRVNVSARPAETGLAMVAHCARDDITGEHKITLSTAFALEAPAAREGESLILTCAHTLEEIRRSRLVSSARRLTTGSFLILPSFPLTLHPLTSIHSSLPRSDLILFSAAAPRVRTLPISPYPVPNGSRVLTHLVHDARPGSHQPRPPLDASPFVPTLRAAWTGSAVTGYRNPAGGEAQPGTYDALSTMLFDPVPTPGSSGGPVVDADTGTVVGVVLGSRMDYGSKLRGWGVPSEAIFEMFSLPGLAAKR